MKNTKKRKAFTLAEVLITLTIIGVVAAVTVPTLTKKTGNQEYVTRLQKVYSVLSQATDEIMYEYGSAIRWAKDANTVYDLYIKHLRGSKECGNATGCFKQGIINRLDGKSSGDSFDNTDENKYKFILSDGIQVAIWFYSSNCDRDFDGRFTNACASVFIDVNGSKKPNIYGRDFFEFILKADGIYPSGCDFDNNCNVQSSNGLGCTCKVITEGEMNY